MRVITLQDVWDFKDACKRVQAQQKIGDSGLCKAVDKQSFDLSYLFFLRLLTETEYFDGLGPRGVFTEERRHFLDFLINMPGNDMLDILNQDC